MHLRRSTLMYGIYDSLSTQGLYCGHTSAWLGLLADVTRMFPNNLSTLSTEQAMEML